MARVLEPIPALAAQWDADIWLVNTPGGAINLKLGDKGAFELRPGRAADYCTKMTAAAPGGECPVFLQFLQETTGGDKELQAYLQMMFGYCLTGSMKEQVLFDIFGPPGTGKTTLVETVSKAMGSYCENAPIDTFTEHQYPQHSTELARLKGARLVTTAETADGHFLAETRVNSISGGSPITARFLFQNDTTYMPTFKLLIEGNFRPRLKNPNGGIRRRVRLLPLNTPIAKRDGDLPEKLRLEYGGILAWQIEGCRKWQEAGGLKSPRSVVDATDEYLSSEDTIGRWLDERTEKNLLPVIAPSAALYGDYKQWSEAGKEFFYNAKRFAQELEDRGYRPARSKNARGFLGLKLLNQGGG
jgi:putative DNA primase/helicase